MEFKEACVETLEDCKDLVVGMFNIKFWLLILGILCSICAVVSGLAVFTWTIATVFSEVRDGIGLMISAAGVIFLVSGFLTSVLGKMVRGMGYE